MSQPPTLTLRYSELRRLLAPVIPHAAAPAELPALQQIPVARSGEFIVSQATDRFTAAFQRVRPASGMPDDFSVSVAASDATRALTLLKPSRGQDPDIEWSVDHIGRQRFTSEQGGLAIGTESLDLTFPAPAMSVQPLDYPDLSKLLPTDMGESSQTVGLNIELLTRFKVALAAQPDPRRLSLEFHLGPTPTSPVLVAIGADFLGLVMPRRMTENGRAVHEVVAEFRDMGIPPAATPTLATKPERN